MLTADIIEKLSNQIQPDEVVVDEEETKWRRYQLLLFVYFSEVILDFQLFEDNIAFVKINR